GVRANERGTGRGDRLRAGRHAGRGRAGGRQHGCAAPVTRVRPGHVRMRDHVRFHSIAFTPTDADPGQVNTERYGYALATWVAARLQERGFEADSPVPEDWGWLLG